MKIKDQLRCELARRDFWEYCRLMYPTFYKTERTYLKELCNALQDFLFNDNEYMIINAPPRHGKSFTAMNFVEWSLGKNPTLKIISGSYNEDLSKTFSKKIRGTIETEKIDDRIIYNDIFAETKIKFGSAEAKKWQTDKSTQINYLATSPTGTATGFGADIEVIDDLIKSDLEANNETVLEKQWEWFCFEGETKVNTKKGYKKIKDICVGDKVLTYNHSQCIIEEKKVVKTKNKLSNIYRLEFENGKQIETTGNHKFYTNRGYKTVEEILYHMWGRIEEGQTILFEEMFKPSKSKQITESEMFELSKGDKHREKKQTEEILFYRMPTSTQNKNVKFKIRNVEQDKGGSEKRIQAMSKMWEVKQFTRSSYRPRHKKQRINKFNGFMRIVPFKLSQVTRLQKDDFKRVYDIEIEDNHNFFVDDILVHNCNTMLSRREGKKKVLIIMTRWRTKDLAGRIIDMLNTKGTKYTHINFKAKSGDTMLCDDIFNLEDYQNAFELMGEDTFNANYQQEPIDLKNALYSNLKEYDEVPKEIRAIENYTDTADTGDDSLCSINYVVGSDLNAYITDILFTKEPMEVTEKMCAEMLTKGRVNWARIESNNGGRGFSRNVERISREKFKNTITMFKPFHQSQNKISRILTGSTGVMNCVYFPKGWKEKYPEFYNAIVTYQRIGKNKHDDAPDCLTGVYETLEKRYRKKGSLSGLKL